MNLNTFNPADYPDYTLFRILEYGDERAVAWMKEAFPEAQIRRVLSTERRLSRRSANLWALVYGITPEDVAALRRGGLSHGEQGTPVAPGSARSQG